MNWRLNFVLQRRRRWLWHFKILMGHPCENLWPLMQSEWKPLMGTAGGSLLWRLTLPECWMASRKVESRIGLDGLQIMDYWEDMLRAVEGSNQLSSLRVLGTSVEWTNVALRRLERHLRQLQLVALVRLLLGGTSQIPTVLPVLTRFYRASHHSHVCSISGTSLFVAFGVSSCWWLDF